MTKDIQMSSTKMIAALGLIISITSLVFDLGSGHLGIAAALAQQSAADGAGTTGIEGLSGFEIIFKRHYPDLECKDAPTVLNGSGITCQYGVVDMPFRDDRTWEVRNNRIQNRPRGEMIKTFPTMNDMKYLLSLSDLDMSDILKYNELLTSGNREELISAFTRLINPKMDKYNKKEIEGYDPNHCINDARNYIYNLRIEDSVLDDVRGKQPPPHFMSRLLIVGI